MVFIYALKLENNKYYIGKTNNPSFRIESHFNTEGSFWTKKYKPIQVLELIPNFFTKIINSFIEIKSFFQSEIELLPNHMLVVI